MPTNNNETEMLKKKYNADFQANNSILHYYWNSFTCFIAYSPSVWNALF